jgi:hypothetical protein
MPAGACFLRLHKPKLRTNPVAINPHCIVALSKSVCCSMLVLLDPYFFYVEVV